jgi:hypothetical protein
MKQSLARIALVVRDYDEAIALFTRALRFGNSADLISLPGPADGGGRCELALRR